MRLAIYWVIIALIALAFTVAPNGDATLSAVLTTLSIVFFVALALFAYRAYHQYSFTRESLSDRQTWVLYGAIGVALLNFTATSRLFNAGGLGVLVWLMILGACSYGVMWVYVSYTRYE